jgi:hypothetical protein
MLMRRRAPPLTWVYDCGTSSSDELLREALTCFAAERAALSGGSIRLAVLSHFDKDHISGFVRLLDSTRVRTVLLPYIPIWQRLVIALEQGVAADDPLLEFFLDPAAFLTRADDHGIEEILFVPPSGPDDLPDEPGPAAEGEEGPFEGSEGGDLLKIDYGDPPAEAATDVITAAAAGAAVRFLRPAGRLLAPRFWEFVPYNDAEMAPKATPAFLHAATPLLHSLLNDASERSNALQALKKLYARTFGKSSMAKNVISLFLYSGPLGGRTFLWPWALYAGSAGASAIDRCSQMHTGDGLLDSPARYDRFERFFVSGGRLARCAFLQVMHHGARGSWHEGLASKLSPIVSVFSSDPAHKGYGHPHAEVLRDFWPYGAVQVDSSHRLCFYGLQESR